tara:strand:- start:2165 stop:3451 length:1287 start_codon:yes stop_codon:yes gene_type:complete
MKIQQTIFLLMINMLFASIDNYILQIEADLKDKNYENASQTIEKAIGEFDSNSKLYYLGAQVAIKLDDLDKANRYYIKSIELDKKNKEYRSAQKKLLELKNALTSARKSFDNGLINDAIAEYEKLIIKYSEHAIVFYNLGLIYKANGDYGLAVKNYKIAQKLNPFAKKYLSAVYAISQMIAKEGDQDYRRQEFDLAISKYEDAISYNPDYAIAFFKLARTYYKLKDYENAQISLQNGLLIDPHQEQSEKMLGDIYRKNGNTNEALNHYNRAIEINGNYYQAFYSLGSLYLSEGDFENAKISLNSAIRFNPSYAKAHGALGTVEQELGNIKLAILNYTKAVDIEPKLYDVHYRLASVFNEDGQYDKAKESAKKSISLKRNYAPAFFELGLAEKSLGNKVAAKDAFEKAKKDRNWRKSAEFELDMLNKGF